VLEGRVSNVAAFGAFVDIGVHQDGLVHVSALSHRYVKDPREVVKAGDIVKVKVLEVDIARKRIALTLRLDDAPGEARGTPGARDRGDANRTGDAGRGRDAGPRGNKPGDRGNARPGARDEQRRGAGTGSAPANNALADAFARAKQR
jgi:uncharacterized protein